MTSGNKTVVCEHTLHYIVSIRRHHTGCRVIKACHITVHNYLKAEVLSLVEFKDREKAAIVPYPSDIIQYSETCLKGKMGRRRELSLSESSCSAEDKICKNVY
jgi:hypothetical protein